MDSSEDHTRTGTTGKGGKLGCFPIIARNGKPQPILRECSMSVAFFHQFASAIARSEVFFLSRATYATLQGHGTGISYEIDRSADWNPTTGGKPTLGPTVAILPRPPGIRVATTTARILSTIRIMRIDGSVYHNEQENPQAGRQQDRPKRRQEVRDDHPRASLQPEEHRHRL